VNQPALTHLTIDGLRVAHAIARPAADNGLPILLLHGWGVNSGLMWGAAELLAALGYPAYVPDLPGFGESEAPPVAWGVPDYANFVLKYLDAHNLTTVRLIGHSFGGRISLILGAEQPERVVKMALADSAGVPPKRDPVAQARLNLYKGIRDGLTNLGAKGLANKLREGYNARYGSADFQAAGGVMRETFVKVVNQDLLPYAARVKAPTLLFWGDKDEDTPLWMGQTLEKTMPDAGLIVFEGAGHYSYLERLGEFVRVVDHFFKN
jgi:pimeloyl-ACP methyl ester carboxylesterase